MWKTASVDCDVDEFTATVEMVSHLLTKVACASSPHPSLHQKLIQFAHLLASFEKIVSECGTGLPDLLNSARRRRKVTKINSQIHVELKWVVDASGSSETDMHSLKVRSLQRITIEEGRFASLLLANPKAANSGKIISWM